MEAWGEYIKGSDRSDLPTPNQHHRESATTQHPDHHANQPGLFLTDRPLIPKRVRRRSWTDIERDRKLPRLDGRSLGRQVHVHSLHRRALGLELSQPLRFRHAHPPPHLLRHLKNVVWLTPCFPSTSLTATPASASVRMPTIWLSLNFDFRVAPPWTERSTLQQRSIREACV